MKQFKGEYGFNLCLHSGVQVPKGHRTARIHPVHEDDNTHGEGLRNRVITEMHAKNGIYGVKSRSALFDIPDFNVISEVPIDWMHAVLLRVCRQFAKCWFQSNDNDSNNGRFRQHLNTANELINSH